ncbi:unnamed protein product [Effrenium voratum]|uniref:Poly(A) RNA polymerase mitochondrial-like central palm domain-containing protein n=1 Tax=Effrenium voratum TaxID=2562239 RepID=A0AA36J8H3_9DINO|nr:unnamed protein product [Effrenium voratum]
MAAVKGPAIPSMKLPPRVEAIRDRILPAASEVSPLAQIYAFGSSVNGFGDENSDVDLVVDMGPATPGDQRSWHGRAVDCLEAISDRLSEVEDVRVVEEVMTAKVPILKLKVEGVDCDLSCNNLLPVFNTQLLRRYSELEPRVVELAGELKNWARKQGLHGAFNGHLSSYSFVLLAIFYMQQRGALPCLQREAETRPRAYHEGGKTFNVWMDEYLGTWRRKTSQELDELSLRDFAIFMTEELGWGHHVVSVRLGQSLPLDKFPHLSVKYIDDECLHIEDPFDVQRNLACVFRGYNRGNSNRRLWWGLKKLSDKAKPQLPLPEPEEQVQSQEI